MKLKTTRHRTIWARLVQPIFHNIIERRPLRGPSAASASVKLQSKQMAVENEAAQESAEGTSPPSNAVASILSSSFRLQWRRV
ncbi:hypothetical protein PS1_011448 [Malus domestica]